MNYISRGPDRSSIILFSKSVWNAGSATWIITRPHSIERVLGLRLHLSIQYTQVHHAGWGGTGTKPWA